MRDRRLFPSPSASPPQAGFTLVELLVAMVIGVMVVLGATQLFVASQRSYQITTALANMQDTGRFALETLSRELRHADFTGGCAASQTTVDDAVRPAVALQGFSHPPESRDEAVSDSHSIAFRGGPVQGTAYYEIEDPSKVLPEAYKGHLVLLQGLQTCALFYNAASMPSGWPAFENTDYLQGNPLLMALDSATYYLGADSNNDDTLSLMRLDTSTPTPRSEVLASHIVALRARFLVDDAYQAPDNIEDTDWNAVRAVRISLVVQSERDDLRPTSTVIETGNFDDEAFTGSAGRLYQAFTTTITLRNRS
ncbi:PilW family protein [Vreelandella sp. EE27]